MPSFVEHLPAINATLNATATVLLLFGYGLIKQRRENAHQRAMMAAFFVSIAFLACYLTYHAYLYHYTAAGHVEFAGPKSVKGLYLAILFSHIVLAAAVPILAGLTIYLGYRDRRRAHRKLACWTFPIWLYVSITGVVIYAILYHVYPPPKPGDTIHEPQAVTANAWSEPCGDSEKLTEIESGSSGSVRMLTAR
ncbi:MAG: DUF420 domain-containing protein [Pirellulales bacterium]|nr:DUF420 domain-containing protein [Pirellulales bacterium]